MGDVLRVIQYRLSILAQGDPGISESCSEVRMK